jgi:hypothetical protein
VRADARVNDATAVWQTRPDDVGPA